MTPARIAAAAIFGLLLSARVRAQQDASLPEGNAYIRSVLEGRQPQDAAINDYTYNLEEERENLDGALRTTSRERRGYEVYFVQKRPVRRLVSKNGIPLNPKEQAEVDGKANERAKAIAEGRTVREQPGIRLTSLLDSFDFQTVGRETRDGRATLVLDFKPRGEEDGASSPNRVAREMTRILNGRVLIDEVDRRVALLDAKNAAGRKASVSTGVKVEAFEMSMDYARVEEGVWLPRRVVTLASGRAFFFKTFRVRQTTTYSNYRRFSVSTEEKPR